mmetsp:Transcript_22610/g.47674  ORF Transcript_22610/g.47674 Transcript_22610/m.47674 type:complete len:266 (-) Transcript_22610:40-837(-)
MPALVAHADRQVQLSRRVQLVGQLRVHVGEPDVVVSVHGQPVGEVEEPPAECRHRPVGERVPNHQDVLGDGLRVVDLQHLPARPVKDQQPVGIALVPQVQAADLPELWHFQNILHSQAAFHIHDFWDHAVRKLVVLKSVPVVVPDAEGVEGHVRREHQVHVAHLVVVAGPDSDGGVAGLSVVSARCCPVRPLPQLVHGGVFCEEVGQLSVAGHNRLVVHGQRDVSRVLVAVHSVREQVCRPCAFHTALGFHLDSLLLRREAELVV